MAREERVSIRSGQENQLNITIKTRSLQEEMTGVKPVSIFFMTIEAGR